LPDKKSPLPYRGAGNFAQRALICPLQVADCEDVRLESGVTDFGFPEILLVAAPRMSPLEVFKLRTYYKHFFLTLLGR
jgi:hypothetical protein